MSSVNDTLRGPAFVLGNGPSLPVEDLACLTGQFTVGVNRILRSGFVPTVLLWVDCTAYRDDGEQIDGSGALLVCDRSVAQRQFHVGLRTWVGSGALKHESRPNVLCVNGNTGCCAARWALALGFEPVYLVGMSATYREGVTDFYGANRYHHNKPGDNGTLMVMRKEMVRLRRDFGERIYEIPDGVLLREIAAELPQQDQGELRSAVMEAIEAAGDQMPSVRSLAEKYGIPLLDQQDEIDVLTGKRFSDD